MKRRIANKVLKKESLGLIFYRESTFTKAANKADIRQFFKRFRTFLARIQPS